MPCRHLFETTARRLLADNPRVEFVYGVTVTGLLFDGDGTQAAEAEAEAAAAAADRAAASGSAAGSQQYNTVTGMRRCFRAGVAGSTDELIMGDAFFMRTWRAASCGQRLISVAASMLIVCMCGCVYQGSVMCTH